MISITLAEAEDELMAAARWHEERKPGLGKRFLTEIRTLIDKIAEKPYAHGENSQGFRRANAKIFSYFVAYKIRADTVVVNRRNLARET